MQGHCQTHPMVSIDTTGPQMSFENPNRVVFEGGFLPWCPSELWALGSSLPLQQETGTQPGPGMVL